MLFCVLLFKKKVLVKSKKYDIDEDQVIELLIVTYKIMWGKKNIALKNTLKIEVEVESEVLKNYMTTKNKWLNPTDSFGKFEKGVEKE